MDHEKDKIKRETKIFSSRYTLRIQMAVILKWHIVLFNVLLLKKKICIKLLIYKDQDKVLFG